MFSPSQCLGPWGNKIRKKSKLTDTHSASAGLLEKSWGCRFEVFKRVVSCLLSFLSCLAHLLLCLLSPFLLSPPSLHFVAFPTEHTFLLPDAISKCFVFLREYFQGQLIKASCQCPRLCPWPLTNPCTILPMGIFPQQVTPGIIFKMINNERTFGFLSALSPLKGLIELSWPWIYYVAEDYSELLILRGLGLQECITIPFYMLWGMGPRGLRMLGKHSTHSYMPSPWHFLMGWVTILQISILFYQRLLCDSNNCEKTWGENHCHTPIRETDDRGNKSRKPQLSLSISNTTPPNTHTHKPSHWLQVLKIVSNAVLHLDNYFCLQF